jgi:S-methylmethionine-dependent homocysteine/selenocysteine methylase
VETDGRLPTGETLAATIAEVDGAAGAPPAYYMINCAHPSHFAGELAGGGDWIARVRGIRANASRISHVELDEATELDDGNPAELANAYVALADRLAHINVFGGCCGTDHRHVAQISAACRHTAARRAA